MDCCWRATIELKAATPGALGWSASMTAVNADQHQARRTRGSFRQASTHWPPRKDFIFSLIWAPWVMEALKASNYFKVQPGCCSRDAFGNFNLSAEAALLKWLKAERFLRWTIEWSGQRQSLRLSDHSCRPVSEEVFLHLQKELLSPAWTRHPVFGRRVSSSSGSKISTALRLGNMAMRTEYMQMPLVLCTLQQSILMYSEKHMYICHFIHRNSFICSQRLKQINVLRTITPTSPAQKTVLRKWSLTNQPTYLEMLKAITTFLNILETVVFPGLPPHTFHFSGVLTTTMLQAFNS